MIGSTLYEALDDKLKTDDHVFACLENGLNVFPLDEIKRIPYFEVVEENVYVYGCSKYGVMKCPEKISPLIKGSIATPSLVAGIMNSLPFPSAWL